MGDRTIVRTGLESTTKKFSWYIDQFDFFDGDLENFITQGFNFSIRSNGNIPSTKWKIFLCHSTIYAFDSQYDCYDYETVEGTAIKLAYKSTSPDWTQGLKDDIVFHTVTGSIIDSDGKSNWQSKTFKSGWQDAFQIPIFRVGMDYTIFSLPPDEFPKFPLQKDGSLLIEFSFCICRKKVLPEITDCE